MALKRRKPGAEKKGPLSGIKVLELAGVLAGPSVGMFLAELGADVIKVENPRFGGDITRKWKLQEEKNLPTSSYFRAVNQKKKHVFLDLREPGAGTIIDNLLSGCDVLLTNFKPGDDRKFGLQKSRVCRKFPRLVYGHITGYGDDDPRPAFDLCLQAESGFMSMNGIARSGPLKMPVAMIDILAAHHLKEGVMTALYSREKTGKGAYVQVSLFDAALVSLSYLASGYFTNKKSPALSGSLHPTIAPYGETFHLKDGSILVLAVGTDHQFEIICRSLDVPQLATDPKFSTNVNRVKNRKKLFSIFSRHICPLTKRQFGKKVNPNDVPYAFVLTVGEALALPAAQKLVLHDEYGKVLKSVIFR